MAEMTFEETLEAIETMSQMVVRAQAKPSEVMDELDRHLLDLKWRNEFFLFDAEPAYQILYRGCPPGTRLIGQHEQTTNRVWYAIRHPKAMHSALADFACELRDRDHPFAAGILGFGTELKRLAEQYRLFHEGERVNPYHFHLLHGKYGIVLKRYALQDYLGGTHASA